MTKRQRLNSLEQVLQRYHAAEESQVERAMQKVLDDLPIKENLYSN